MLRLLIFSNLFVRPLSPEPPATSRPASISPQAWDRRLPAGPQQSPLDPPLSGVALIPSINRRQSQQMSIERLAMVAR